MLLSNVIWFTFKPIPIIDWLIDLLLIWFSINIPPIFLELTKISFGHLIYAAIDRSDNAFCTDNDAIIFK